MPNLLCARTESCLPSVFCAAAAASSLSLAEVVASLVGVAAGLAGAAVGLAGAAVGLAGAAVAFAGAVGLTVCAQVTLVLANAKRSVAIITVCFISNRVF